MNIPSEEMSSSLLSEHNGMLPNATIGNMEYAVLLNTFSVDTKVYISYSLEEAFSRKTALEKDTGVGWRVAVILR